MAEANTNRSPVLSTVSRYGDLAIALAAVTVVGMMVIPLPQWLLDVLLSLNVALALTVLLVSVYVEEPLQFAAFPSLLLLVTLFRLGLNISATRLILLNGEAGAVIAAFGAFVVGGNLVVGVVVFIVLIVIQFIVITNGAGRVAEVAARFTLDAMPGKQMAIDADLNAGVIDEAEARRRRQRVAQEADFYGAMDGASKFVRGDAIAAILIVVVNVVGGFVIGLAQRGMPFDQALNTYALLTVGEGIVTQIPALLISTAAGLMVTKSSSDIHLGVQLAGQMLSYPRALAVTSAVLAALGVVPGLPKLPFFLASAGVAALAYAVNQTKKLPPPPPPPQPKPPENMLEHVGVDALEVEVGYALISLADPKQGGDLLERITAARRQVAVELGLIVPPVRVRDNMQLPPNDYVIRLRGSLVARGTLYPGQYLAMNPGTATSTLPGQPTTEPAFGLPALWIPSSSRDTAVSSGYTVVDAMTVLITHLSEVFRKHAPELLSRQDVQTLLDRVKVQSPALVDGVVPDQITLGEVHRVLRLLLKERVSIKDMPTILEALSDASALTRDPVMLAEHVRSALARHITEQHREADGKLYVVVVDPRVERAILDRVRTTDAGAVAAPDPHFVQRLASEAGRLLEESAALGREAVILCSPRVRPFLRSLLERPLPRSAVLSHNEVADDAQIEVVATLRIDVPEDTAVAASGEKQ